MPFIASLLTSLTFRGDKLDVDVERVVAVDVERVVAVDCEGEGRALRVGLLVLPAKSMEV